MVHPLRDRDEASVDSELPCHTESKPSPSNMEMKLDATGLIFLGYAKTLQKFSPRRQLEMKTKISQIISQQELEQLEEDAAKRDEANAVGSWTPISAHSSTGYSDCTTVE
ncbi:hypothetical protein PR048_011678, partial [Dryococelus australis]